VPRTTPPLAGSGGLPVALSAALSAPLSAAPASSRIVAVSVSERIGSSVTTLFTERELETMPPATAGTSAARVREQLLQLLEPVVAKAGYDLEDVTVAAAGRRKLVRVTVDADGGVDLDAVADVSRAVSEALDTDRQAQSTLAGPYVLEVSSPGVDRPLVEPRHWRRAAGRLVQVPVGERAVVGRVVGTDEAGVTLEQEGTRTVYPWDELGHGKVQVEFSRAGEWEED
jgi:ribosome maturation factor RimP